MTDYPVPGFSIGIVKDGQVVYTRGFGVAKHGTEQPMTPKTLFPIASTVKPYTALAVMQLVQGGLIDLDAPR